MLYTLDDNGYVLLENVRYIDESPYVNSYAYKIIN